MGGWLGGGSGLVLVVVERRVGRWRHMERACTGIESRSSCRPPLFTVIPPFTLPERSGWHQLKHGSKAARGNREQKQSLGELIRLHCQVGWGELLAVVLHQHPPRSAAT